MHNVVLLNVVLNVVFFSMLIKLLETPLHNACWHGMPAQTCLRLCAAGARVDAINKVNMTS